MLGKIAYSKNNPLIVAQAICFKKAHGIYTHFLLMNNLVSALAIVARL
jgi:hypothetical protein